MTGRPIHRNLLANRERQVFETRRMVSIGLPNFETVPQCVARNERILRRFQKHGSPAVNRFLQAIKPSGGGDDHCDLDVDGDWLASRRYRSMLIPQAIDLLNRHPGPLHFVTITHPRWELPKGQLKKANVDAAKQWLRRRLKRLAFPVTVVGGYEASLSVELNGDAFWAGHLHFVIAGADESELKTSLKIENHYRKRKHSKPVLVEPIGTLSQRLGYSTKRIGQRRVAYIGENGRQQRNKLPLILSEQIEFDAWLLKMPAGSRTVLFGCRLHCDRLRAIQPGS
jgi:hypothetical protein